MLLLNKKCANIEIYNQLSFIYNLLADNNYKNSCKNLKCFLKINSNQEIILHKFYNSKTLPLEITIDQKYLYKPKSNLTRDYFFNILTDYIFILCKVPYKMSKIDTKKNLIELKDSETLGYFKDVTKFKTYILKNPIENFLQSFSISLLINYFYEIGDRTLDNMIIDKNGFFYNIDFEYILGEDPKYYLDFVIPEVISNFLKSDLLIYEKFKEFVCFYYKVIKKNYKKILVYAKKLYEKENYDFDIFKLERIFINKIFVITEKTLINKIDKAMKCYKTKLIHLINKINKMEICKKFLIL